MVHSLPPFLGPYEVLSRLGSGGMGEVYVARDSRLGRKVAIKVLLPAFTANPERLARFEQEIRSLALLSHPNILQIHDTGAHEGRPYLVMELLEGQTLRQRLEGHPLPPRKAVDFALQVARGLAAAHEKGITHRDLKPENLFITAGEQVKILDFGLAKLRVPASADSDATQAMEASPSLTETGIVVGTVGYLSPEQVVGRPADARSDLFTLGSILWEMLCGAKPFRGDSSVETMHAILKEELPPWPGEIPLPPGLERILFRCLEKDPRARFQSAQDLAFNLETLSFDNPSLPQKIAPPPASRRSFWKLGLGAAGLGLLLGLGGLWLGLVKGQTRPLSLQRLTYQPGQISSARFGPDGQTFVFSLSRNGAPPELWTGRADAIGSRPLDLPPGTDILSVSSTGEMAVLLHREMWQPGTLARVPMGGGSPRELVERVWGADWSPDGRELAIVREGPGGRHQLEFPVGNLLYEAPENASLICPRVSPRGDQVAFILDIPGSASLCLVDPAKHLRTLVASGCGSLAWAPDGNELLFTSRLLEDRREIRSVTLGGKERTLYSPLGLLYLHDISRTGRLLVDHTFTRMGILAHVPGEAGERELSWFQSSELADISQDGRLILFGEHQEGGGHGGAYLRKVDSRDAIRLGDGDPLSLSPDGKWAVVFTPDPTSKLTLLPTGPGEAKRLPSHGLAIGWVAFLRDGRRLLIGGVNDQKTFGYYLQDIATGELRRLEGEASAEGTGAASPDGSRVAIGPAGGSLRLHSLQGGPLQTLEGFAEGETVLQWGADGRFLLVGDLSRLPAKIHRIDLATGKRTLWKELAPAGMLGLTGIPTLSVTPDGRYYAYSYQQTLTSDLFVMEGWKEPPGDPR